MRVQFGIGKDWAPHPEERDALNLRWAPTGWSGVVGGAKRHIIFLYLVKHRESEKVAADDLQKKQDEGCYSALQYAAEATLQLRAYFFYFHASHDHKFARNHFARFIVIGQLTLDTAILAILVPTETPVRDRLRTNELEATEQRVFLRNLEFLAHDFYGNQFFVGTKGARHVVILLTGERIAFLEVVELNDLRCKFRGSFRFQVPLL